MPPLDPDSFRSGVHCAAPASSRRVCSVTDLVTTNELHGPGVSSGPYYLTSGGSKQHDIPGATNSVYYDPTVLGVERINGAYQVLLKR